MLNRNPVLNNKPKDFIVWDPKYRVGIPVIDAQHEHLVKLCNEFYMSLLKNNDSEGYQKLVKETLQTCLDYAGTHFREEERLMTASKFDGYRQHKASHEAFTEKCKITWLGIDKLPVAEAIKFAHFLRDWIHNHIAHEDRLYIPALVEFLKKNTSKTE